MASIDVTDGTEVGPILGGERHGISRLRERAKMDI